MPGIGDLPVLKGKQLLERPPSFPLSTNEKVDDAIIRLDTKDGLATKLKVRLLRHGKKRFFAKLRHGKRNWMMWSGRLSSK